MKSIYSFSLALVLLSCVASSARPIQKQTAPADRLGLTCTQILQMSSTDWTKKFTAAKDPNEPSTLQAISTYGKCYEARTTRLAASLAKSGKGPLMGARGNFGDFDRALTDFTAKALAATDPPADAQKKAYAALYAKQFRYLFYEAYVEHLDTRNIFLAAPEDAGDMGKVKITLVSFWGYSQRTKCTKSTSHSRKFSTKQWSIVTGDFNSISLSSSSSNPRQKLRTPRPRFDRLLCFFS